MSFSLTYCQSRLKNLVCISILPKVEHVDFCFFSIKSISNKWTETLTLSSWTQLTSSGFHSVNHEASRTWFSFLSPVWWNGTQSGVQYWVAPRVQKAKNKNCLASVALDFGTPLASEIDFILTPEMRRCSLGVGE